MSGRGVSSGTWSGDPLNVLAASWGGYDCMLTTSIAGEVGWASTKGNNHGKHEFQQTRPDVDRHSSQWQRRCESSPASGCSSRRISGPLHPRSRHGAAIRDTNWCNIRRSRNDKLRRVGEEAGRARKLGALPQQPQSYCRPDPSLQIRTVCAVSLGQRCAAGLAQSSIGEHGQGRSFKEK